MPKRSSKRHQGPFVSDDETSTPGRKAFSLPPAPNGAILDPSGQTAPPPKAKAKPRSHDGHRKRLRHRLVAGGADAMADYELLELVLCRAIARTDVKPLAKAMLKEFSSIAELLSASPHRLQKISGVGPRIVEELVLVRALGLRMLRRRLDQRKILPNSEAVINHLRATQSYDEKESFRILFLDKSSQLIADEVHSRGTIAQSAVYIRELVQRAIELAATAVILVHNHPSGSLTPSQPDIDTTRLVIEASRLFDIEVVDHIIVSPVGHVSMRSTRDWPNSP